MDNQHCLRADAWAFLACLLAFENIIGCSKIRGNSGQLFNRWDGCNCEFFNPNASLQLCQHLHVRQVLTAYSRLPDNVFSFRDPTDSREPVSKLSPNADDSRTFSTCRSQK